MLGVAHPQPGRVCPGPTWQRKGRMGLEPGGRAELALVLPQALMQPAIAAHLVHAEQRGGGAGAGLVCRGHARDCTTSNEGVTGTGACGMSPHCAVHAHLAVTACVGQTATAQDSLKQATAGRGEHLGARVCCLPSTGFCR